MASPFPKSSSAAGEGRVVTKLMPNGLSGLETVTYQYPLKLISPRPAVDQKSALVFLLSYGGGLVGGDSVSLSIDVLDRSRLSIVTQGHTKIFRSPSLSVVTRQTLHVRIANDAGLCLLPDPVQPFESSVYEQTQIFNVDPRASLCLLDWVTQGRLARGEDWSFLRWKGRNEVWLRQDPAAEKGRLLVRDAIVLDSGILDTTGRPLKSSLHAHGVVGTLILRGPHMSALGDFFLAEFSALPRLGIKDFRTAEAKAAEDKKRTSQQKWREGRLKMETTYSVIWSAARVRGCVIVRFGAGTVEGGRLWMGEMLQTQGSVAEQYGEQALMCLR
ncbi:UreD urease accessory protein [Plectosphaerella plurivora]|uniref:UreD urease accessory protein n=1 Tax=Plectosphaerella plurivora TaxID=936078 RepID=A0A9P9A7W0_9PEZI|nr:UreD urease accessory protein [Plectosphaerella plurivora]